MKRVVITGIGVITPIGNNINDFWNNLLNGNSGANMISRFDTSKFKTKFACEVKGFNELEFFNKKEARKLDRVTKFGLVASEQAIKDANLIFEHLNLNRIGVIFSSGIGGFETFQNEVINYCVNSHVPKFNPFFITKIIPNSTAGHISIKYGLKGINSCPVTACASSTNGIIQAYNYIKWNKADIIITGGSEAPITEAAIGGFNSMKALSTNNENFKTASKPFDALRDGFVIGEGAGALVVESLESALNRNAEIYAEIIGGGETSDAYHITGTHPNGEGAYQAMKEAIREGNINTNEINYINAHATSTGIGDLSEVNAITRLFSKDLDKIKISGTKSMTGHLLGGTGAIETIATCLSIKSDLIPPTINTSILDERISKDFKLVMNVKIKTKINYAMSNSFGFGGHCATVLLKKYVG